MILRVRRNFFEITTFPNTKKLDDALWAYRTAYENPMGMSPYKMVYGKPCHLPLELEHKAYILGY